MDDDAPRRETSGEGGKDHRSLASYNASGFRCDLAVIALLAMLGMLFVGYKLASILGILG